MSGMVDAWAGAAEYEAFMGRWSRVLAPAFLAWLPESALPAGMTALDVGCGTGALGAALLDARPDARLLAVDASPAYAAAARRALHARRAVVVVADARALPWDAGQADVVLSSLVLNFVPEPERAVAEMRRVARRGGVVAACVWDYADGMRMLRLFWDAAVAIDPAAVELDEGRRFPLCDPAALESLWREAGLARVESGIVEVDTRFSDMDDLWAPFLGGQGPAPGYVRRLDAETRERLRERLERSLPSATAGVVALTARAWAVRGVLE
ncbi:MAG TPA: class I SAM-dependent methyltransferase [Gemmatimonadales bacterium]